MSCFIPKSEKLSPPKSGWKQLLRTLRSKLYFLRRLKSLNMKKSTNPRFTAQCWTSTRHHHHQHRHYYQYTYSYDEGQQPHPKSLQGRRNEAATTYQTGDEDGTDDYHDAVGDDEIHEEEEEEDDGVHDQYAIAIGDTATSTAMQLWGVDAQAEEFIERFYQRLKLEKQRSNELRAMLAHSAN